jgi:hypothetical protein
MHHRHACSSIWLQHGLSVLSRSKIPADSPLIPRSSTHAYSCLISVCLPLYPSRFITSPCSTSFRLPLPLRSRPASPSQLCIRLPFCITKLPPLSVALQSVHTMSLYSPTYYCIPLLPLYLLAEVIGEPSVDDASGVPKKKVWKHTDQDIMHRWSLAQPQSVAAARGNELIQRPPLGGEFE